MSYLIQVFAVFKIFRKQYFKVEKFAGINYPEKNIATFATFNSRNF